MKRLLLAAILGCFVVTPITRAQNPLLTQKAKTRGLPIVLAFILKCKNTKFSGICQGAHEDYLFTIYPQCP